MTLYFSPGVSRHAGKINAHCACGGEPFRLPQGQLHRAQRAHFRPKNQIVFRGQPKEGFQVFRQLFGKERPPVHAVFHVAEIGAEALRHHHRQAHPAGPQLDAGIAHPVIGVAPADGQQPKHRFCGLRAFLRHQEGIAHGVPNGREHFPAFNQRHVPRLLPAASR